MSDEWDKIGKPVTSQRNAPPAASEWDALGKPVKRRPGFREVFEASPLAAGVGAAETALSLGSGMASSLVGGVRFLGSLAQNQFADPGLDASGRIKGVDQARRQFDAVVEAGTYQPRTYQGRMATGGVMVPMEAWGEGANIAGANVAERTGSPAVGAATNAILSVGPIAGARQPATTVRNNVARTYSDAWQATSPEARLVQPRARDIGQQEPVDMLPAGMPVQSALPPPQTALPPPARRRPGAFPEPAPAALEPPQGPPIPTSVRVVRGAQEVARAITEPLTRQGPEDAAVRLLSRFGFRPEDFEGLSSRPTPTGAQPMLPDQVSSVEGATAAARLMDSLRVDPLQWAEFNARDAANNEARIRTLDRMAGRGGERDAAARAREEITSPIYERALSVELNPAGFTAPQLAYMDALFDRPAIKRALADGQENLRNEGIEGEARYSMRALHAAKVSLDTRIQNAPRNPAETMSVASMRKARDALVRTIEQLSPEYATARQEYARLSQPVNQMDIAGAIRDRGVNATENLAPGAATIPVLSGPKLEQLTTPRNQARTMKDATGRNVGERFEDVMTPEQLQMLDTLVDEVKRKAAVERAANGPGSGTAQRLQAQAILYAIGVGDNPPPLVEAAVDRVTRMANLVTTSDQKLRAAVADLILNPGKARAAFERATPKRQAQRRANNPPPQQ